jgi:hypothetical protein
VGKDAADQALIPPWTSWMQACPFFARNAEAALLRLPDRQTT